MDFLGGCLPPTQDIHDNWPALFVQAPEAPSPEPEISELNFKAVGSTEGERQRENVM